MLHHPFQTIIEDDCLPVDRFAESLLPHLLHLASDRVPNVRILLAKTLRQTLLEKGWWTDILPALGGHLLLGEEASIQRLPLPLVPPGGVPMRGRSH